MVNHDCEAKMSMKWRAIGSHLLNEGQKLYGGTRQTGAIYRKESRWSCDQFLAILLSRSITMETLF